MSGRRDRHVREPAGGRVPVLPPEQRVDAVGEGAQAIVGGILICGGTGADRHGAERLDPLTLEGAASIGIGDPVGRRLDRGDRCPLGRDGVADPQRAICRSLVDLAGLDQIGIADDTLLVEVTGLLDRLDPTFNFLLESTNNDPLRLDCGSDPRSRRITSSPNRCGIAEARNITGLSYRTLQNLASLGAIPGASKPSGR